MGREFFGVGVPRQDVPGLPEERVESPLDAAMFPPSNTDPVGRVRPEAPGRGPGRPQAAGAPSSAGERTSPLRAVPSGYTEPAGYADPGPDRSSSTPHRMAAWHGSPEAEPWPGAQPDPRPDPRSDPRPDPRSDPRNPRDPRADPRAGPGPRFPADPAYEPWPGAQRPEG